MKVSELIDFSPKFFSIFKNYSREKFSADLMAGMIVGVVAIPLAIAFGIASGVGPTEGLVTAIIAGLLISVFGGSKVQIGGPTGAFIVIIYGVIQQYGLAHRLSPATQSTTIPLPVKAIPSPSIGSTVTTSYSPRTGSITVSNSW